MSHVGQKADLTAPKPSVRFAPIADLIVVEHRFLPMDERALEGNSSLCAWTSIEALASNTTRFPDRSSAQSSQNSMK